jgi:hypothetical protein
VLKEPWPAPASPHQIGQSAWVRDSNRGGASGAGICHAVDMLRA